MEKKSHCPSDEETSKQLLRKALEGCTEDEARSRLREIAPSLDMDPTELLGLDVD